MVAFFSSVLGIGRKEGEEGTAENAYVTSVLFIFGPTAVEDEEELKSDAIKVTQSSIAL